MPPENVQQPIDDQIVELLMPQIMTVIVEVFKSVPQEQISEMICEQFVDVSDPRVVGHLVFMPR